MVILFANYCWPIVEELITLALHVGGCHCVVCAYANILVRMHRGMSRPISACRINDNELYAVVRFHASSIVLRDCWCLTMHQLDVYYIH